MLRILEQQSEQIEVAGTAVGVQQPLGDVAGPRIPGHPVPVDEPHRALLIPKQISAVQIAVTNPSLKRHLRRQRIHLRAMEVLKRIGNHALGIGRRIPKDGIHIDGAAAPLDGNPVETHPLDRLFPEADPGGADIGPFREKGKSPSPLV